MKRTAKRIGLMAVVLLLAISVIGLGFPRSGVTIASAEVTVGTEDGELELEEAAEEVTEEASEEVTEEPAEEAEEAIEKPAEETSEEVTEEAAEEVAEEVTEEPAEENVEEVTEEAPEKEIDYSALKVEVFTSMSEVVQKGEEVKLTSKLTGFEGIEYTLQWQYNDGSGWKDVEGATGESYTFAADAKTVNYMWRLTVAIK